jgi:hypothetical protein
VSSCNDSRIHSFYEVELMHLSIRFMRAAQLPDDLEMLLDEQRLGVSAAYADTASVFVSLNVHLQMLAPALRACLSSSDNQLKHFADVSEGALLAAVDASVESLKHQLLRVHREVKDVAHAKLKLEEALKNGLDKYSIRKMATGSIDDFHKGLSDRIGNKVASARISVIVYCLNSSQSSRSCQS